MFFGGTRCALFPLKDTPWIVPTGKALREHPVQQSHVKDEKQDVKHKVTCLHL